MFFNIYKEKKMSIVKLLNEIKTELDKLNQVHKMRISLFEDEKDKFYYFKKIKRNYVNGLFADNQLIKETYSRLSSNVLIESENKFDFDSEIDNFYGFLKESILFNSGLLNESVYNLNEWGWPSWDDVTSAVSSGWNAVKNTVKSGAEYVGNKVSQAYNYVADKLSQAVNWIKNKGLSWIMENIRSALMSGVGTVIQAALAFTGAGAVANDIVWAIMLLYDCYMYFFNSDPKALGNMIIDVICLATAGLAGKYLGKFAGKLIGSAESVLKSLMESSVGKFLKPILEGIGSLGNKIMGGLSSAAAWAEKNMGLTWIRSGITKLTNWWSGFITKVSEVLAGGTAKVIGQKQSLNLLMNKFGLSPLTAALESGNQEIVKRYLQKGIKKQTTALIDKGLSKLKGKAETEIKDYIRKNGGQEYVNFYDELQKDISAAKGTYAVVKPKSTSNTRRA